MHKRAKTLEPLKLKKKPHGTLKVITECSPEPKDVEIFAASTDIDVFNNVLELE